MVAYSFQPMFVAPIKVGLGLLTPQPEGSINRPKRQTVRAPRRGNAGHAIAGTPLQLYCRQRHPSGFLIGHSRCVLTQSIKLHFRENYKRDWIEIGDDKFDRPSSLDAFAIADGFDEWRALRRFWRERHFTDDAMGDFSGVVIVWEPLPVDGAAKQRECSPC